MVLKCVVFAFFSKAQDRSAPNFLQGLGQNTCLIQPALKNTEPGL